MAANLAFQVHSGCRRPFAVHGDSGALISLYIRHKGVIPDRIKDVNESADIQEPFR
jgi:hypothetical protein